MKNYTKEDLFLNLVNQFQQSASIYLGKIKNPQNNKIEKNLSLAVYFLNMLRMLEEKTINNLTDNEAVNLKKIIKQIESDCTRELGSG